MIRVIIVDDEILSRIGMQTFLDGKDGITVQGVFEDASEALSFLEKNSVDVVLTDIEMSEVDGLTFIEKIREKNLAPGILIVSCHEDFSYAQRAIALGTDGYILKHSITESMLMEEVKKVYRKHCDKTGGEEEHRTREHDHSKEIREGNLYRVAVLHLIQEDTELVDADRMESDMLLHLLEDMVQRYHMGTAFAPVNQEPFLLFQWEKESEESVRSRQLQEWLELLDDNMQQYMNGPYVFGVSKEFSELSEMRRRYASAGRAAQMYFYHQEQIIYAGQEMEPERAGSIGTFTAKDFLLEGWMDTFTADLRIFLKDFRDRELGIPEMKAMLLQRLHQLITAVLSAYPLPDVFCDRWSAGTELIAAVTGAKKQEELIERVTSYIEQLRQEMLEMVSSNDLVPAMEYIRNHLSENISLSELSELCYMSIPSFCKKFKERNGVTLVQYINERRIEKAKEYLRLRQYSLEKTAELVGFSNANYLVRVFKKTTGITVSEYRRQHGLTE